MHCAFAKYEQGFKRKNEYLERRRVKRKEEIDRGVQSELKKRGMNGELEDPLLMSTVGPSGMTATHKTNMSTNLEAGGEDSSLGINMGENSE